MTIKNIGDIIYRKATPEDILGIWRVRRDAVQSIAAKDYPEEVINNWGRYTPEGIEKHQTKIKEGRELTWVAVLNEEIVGFSVLIPDKQEIGAVYISPHVTRQHVGTTLLKIVEATAQELGIKKLSMQSSLTAVNFYQYHGYKAIKETVFTLNSGIDMQALEMEKILK